MQISPVRVAVPIGISRQAKTSASANSRTFQPGGKIVPYRARYRMIGMIAIATVEMVDPSYSPELSLEAEVERAVAAAAEPAS